MTNIEFDKLINTIAATYGHKVADDTRRAAWDSLKHIPGKFTDQLIVRLCGMEKWPHGFNIVKGILDAYAVLDPQGACLAGEDNGRWVNDCRECDPGPWRGEITYFTRLEGGEITKHKMPCAVCQPASVRKGTRASIAAQGYMVPPDQAAVTRWFWRMARANNAELFDRVDGEYGGLLRDYGRMARAVVG